MLTFLFFTGKELSHLPSATWYARLRASPLRVAASAPFDARGF